MNTHTHNGRGSTPCMISSYSPGLEKDTYNCTKVYVDKVYVEIQ